LSSKKVWEKYYHSFWILWYVPNLCWDNDLRPTKIFFLLTAGAPTINADPCKFSGIRTIGQRAGVIASPGYSGRETYKNGLNCVWEIDVRLHVDKTSVIRDVL